jgi:hypothetical protein
MLDQVQDWKHTFCNFQTPFEAEEAPLADCGWHALGNSSACPALYANMEADMERSSIGQEMTRREQEPLLSIQGQRF